MNSGLLKEVASNIILSKLHRAYDNENVFKAIYLKLRYEEKFAKYFSKNIEYWLFNCSIVNIFEMIFDTLDLHDLTSDVLNTFSSITVKFYCHPQVLVYLYGRYYSSLTPNINELLSCLYTYEYKNDYANAIGDGYMLLLKFIFAIDVNTCTTVIRYDKNNDLFYTFIDRKRCDLIYIFLKNLQMRNINYSNELFTDFIDYNLIIQLNISNCDTDVNVNVCKYMNKLLRLILRFSNNTHLKNKAHKLLIDKYSTVNEYIKSVGIISEN